MGSTSVGDVSHAAAALGSITKYDVHMAHSYGSELVIPCMAYSPKSDARRDILLPGSDSHYGLIYAHDIPCPERIHMHADIITWNIP